MNHALTLKFNPKASSVMHIDLNSCFATIEQQANPLLRGKAVAVAVYTTSMGCIIAPSVEAKKYGIKVGMRVKDGKFLCPNLVVLSPDPWKYRNVHLALRNLLSDYTGNFVPKSIDEFVLDLESYPAFQRGIWNVAGEIKERIKKEIGDAITVSVGIGPNRFLAKVASNLHKPDGLDEINKDNFLKVYSSLALTDLCGIKLRNMLRLNNMGIYSVLDFYHAPAWKLKAAFQSIAGYYWYLRLHGWEIDDVAFARRSYGNSYALPKPFKEIKDLSPILQKLVVKMASRLRKAGYKTKGIHLAISHRDGTFWHKGQKTFKVLFDSRDIYKRAYRLLLESPYKKPVREIAVSCFNLVKDNFLQLEMFEDVEKKVNLVGVVDAVNERWGSFILTPASMLGTKEYVPDRIAFGGVKELEEFSL
ncbi:MAG: hypothetical protein ABIJ85_03470 [bacterium]